MDEFKLEAEPFDSFEAWKEEAAKEEEELNQWRREQEEALKEILSNPEKKKQLLQFIKDEISFDGMLPDDF